MEMERTMSVAATIAIIAARILVHRILRRMVVAVREEAPTRVEEIRVEDRGRKI